MANSQVSDIASTVWRILKHHGIDPAQKRTNVTWTQFLRSQASDACDFATIDTVLLRRFYLLLFIGHPHVRVVDASTWSGIGTYADPTAFWSPEPPFRLASWKVATDTRR
jgi:putative transposase